MLGAAASLHHCTLQLRTMPSLAQHNSHVHVPRDRAGRRNLVAARHSLSHPSLPAAISLQQTHHIHSPGTARKTHGVSVQCSTSSSYDHPALYTSEDTFAEASYWDRRYKSEGSSTAFEWYRGYSSLRPVLLHYLPPSAGVPLLQLGMGNSRLQIDMVQQDGYKRIVSIDYSQVAVDQQQAAEPQLPELEYQVADARRLGPGFPDASYGGVIDKGTLDALLCGESDEQDSLLLLQEAVRVLQPGGWYLQITHAPPASRLKYLARAELPWQAIEVCEVGQQGVWHGPYRLPLALAQGTAPLQGLPAAKEVFSHWVYACQRSG